MKKLEKGTVVQENKDTEVNEKKVNKTEVKVTKEESKKNKKTTKKEAKKKDNLFKQIKKEMQKVHFPSRKDMIKYSIATIAFVVFFALYFYAIELIMAFIKSLI